jgi:hypothetical protein
VIYEMSSHGTLCASALVMNRNIAASLLPVVFALASLGTVACTADAETADDVAAREPALAIAPALALAGSAGPSTVAPAAPSEARAGATASTLRLVVTDKSGAIATYDVLDFDFGVDMAAGTSSLSSTSDLSTGKPVLRPLQVVVRPNAKSAVLGKNLTGAILLSSVVLQRVDAGAKPVDIAQFDKPFVTRMTTDAGDDTRESYELTTPIVTAKQGGASVTIDLMKGTTTCDGTCTCVKGALGVLGPYTQSGPLGTVPKGSTQVDHVSVELHNEALTGGTGASTGKAVLDGISFDRDLESSGLCAMYYAGLGRSVADLSIGVAGPVQPSGAAIESTTWDACYASVKSVGFSGSSGEPLREKVGLGAFGLLRTDRNFDAITGVDTKQSTMTGWSFAQNKAITTCSAALPTAL